MRCVLPPVALQRQVVNELRDVFAEPSTKALSAALGILTAHYGQAAPRCRWLSFVVPSSCR